MASKKAATSVTIFGTFENFSDFGIYFSFFQQKTLYPVLNVAECEAVPTGTLFHSGATMKLGERGKFRKYSKVPSCFPRMFQECGRKKGKDLKGSILPRGRKKAWVVE